MGTAVVAPILASLIDPFGTSPANIGLLVSMFTAPAILLVPLAGILADQIGRKPVLIGGSIIFGLAGVAIGFTASFELALGLRFLQGMAWGGIGPIVITSLGDLYETTVEATAQGIRIAGAGAALIVVPLASGGLVIAGWWYPFLLYAVALPVGVIIYLWLDEPSNHHKDDNDVALTDTRSQLKDLTTLVREPHILPMILARGFPMFVWMGFITYNSLIVVRVLGGTPAQAGLIVALGSLAMAVSGSQSGRLHALIGGRFPLLLWGNLGLGGGFVMFVMSPTLLVAGLGITVAGFGFGLILTLYRSIITGLASETHRAGLVSVAEAFGRLIATVTPVLMGGVIALGTPRVDVVYAVQLSGVGVAVVASIGGIVCTITAARYGLDLD